MAHKYTFKSKAERDEATKGAQREVDVAWEAVAERLGWLRSSRETHRKAQAQLAKIMGAPIVEPDDANAPD